MFQLKIAHGAIFISRYTFGQGLFFLLKFVKK